MADQVSGKVKWFDKAKGYGFITVDGRAKDVFFHAKEWNAASLSTLPVEGDQLSFTVTPGPKGEYATNILRTGAPNAPSIGGPA